MMRFLKNHFGEFVSGRPRSDAGHSRIIVRTSRLFIKFFIAENPGLTTMALEFPEKPGMLFGQSPAGPRPTRAWGGGEVLF